MSKEQLHEINPHFDKDPRGEAFKKFGWRINQFGEFSMPAHTYIEKLEELENRPLRRSTNWYIDLRGKK